MEKSRNFRTLAVVALVVAIAGLSIAFASLSQILTIGGTTTVKGNTWSIRFAELQAPTLTGQAEEVSSSLVSGATTINFEILLVKPGDSAQYTFKVDNSGEIDAVITSVTLAGATTDVDFTLTYSGGTYDGQSVQVGDELDAGEYENLVLTVTFDEDAASVPDTDTRLDLTATITYTQK